MSESEMSVPQKGLSEKDFADLRKAKLLLENPGYAVKLTNLVGKPIERGMALLPKNWSAVVNKAVNISLTKALEFAVKTMKGTSKSPSREFQHRVGAAVSGGVGGMFGFGSLIFELPVSTIIMLRSIADIARHEGENVKSPETQLACLEVFALGGNSKSDDVAETGYYAVRTALAKLMNEAAKYITEKGLIEEGAPVVVKFIMRIAARYGIIVSEKAAASAIPLIGAISGAAINTIFINHFQDMARGHFTVRRLERSYGEEFIKQEYDKIFLPKK
jgi:hypothetical protein